MCHMSGVRCHMSSPTCCVLCVTCHLGQFSEKTTGLWTTRSDRSAYPKPVMMVCVVLVWYFFANSGAHIQVWNHIKAHIYVWKQLSAPIRFPMQVLEHKKPTYKLWAHMSAHTGLGEHTSAHTSALTSPRMCTFWPGLLPSWFQRQVHQRRQRSSPPYDPGQRPQHGSANQEAGIQRQHFEGSLVPDGREGAGRQLLHQEASKVTYSPI